MIESIRMFKKTFYFGCVLLVLSPGCAQWNSVVRKIPFVPSKTKEVNSAVIEMDKKVLLEALNQEPKHKIGQRFSILDSDRLSSGGKIYFYPFNPGENVEFNEEMDKATLGIVKGVVDVIGGSEMLSFKGIKGQDVPKLKESLSLFEVVFDNTNLEADFFLEGRIVKMETPSKIASLFLRRRNIILGIEGLLLDSKTKKILFSFKDQIEGDKDKINFSALGYQLGARLIQNLSQVD